jgi:hypothetical protein
LFCPVLIHVGHQTDGEMMTKILSFIRVFYTSSHQRSKKKHSSIYQKINGSVQHTHKFYFILLFLFECVFVCAKNIPLGIFKSNALFSPLQRSQKTNAILQTTHTHSKINKIKSTSFHQNDIHLRKAQNFFFATTF